ncbi:MAG: alpha-amylase family glycosyl hydrolase [Trueperaceae bacterium]
MHDLTDNPSPTRFRLSLPEHVPVRRRDLHVARDARARYGVPADAFGVRGRVVQVDFDLAERWAEAMNARRAHDGDDGLVAPAVLPAAALLHELMHAVIATVTAGTGRAAMSEALSSFRASAGSDTATRFLTTLAERFPPPPVADAEVDASAYVKGATDGEPNDEAMLEEFVLLLLAHENRALTPLRELFEFGPLHDDAAYSVAVRSVEDALSAVEVAVPGGPGAEGAPPRTLLDLLRAPFRARPDSLLDQLRIALEMWAPVLGERFQQLLEQVLRAADVLRESHKGGRPGPGPGPGANELLPGFGQAGSEPEAFTPDRAWMPNVTLVAKSTYVWLEQLERRFGREVRRLDQVPDEALAELAANGFNALWLIGVWERSEASRRIKRMRGQLDAEASAYAVHDYVVARDLGGDEALDRLREQASAHGIRLASDMVPNHTGIDARWVVEHPERFVQLDHPPYTGYTFGGPDLSSDPRLEIRIEDHYFDGSDAAVVFQRRDAATGETRYLYHGNDGTAMPWNDTAQLDYLRSDVRAAVMDTIVDVARRFPIVRFDAAMTLARRHVRRLWHPRPGDGGAVPSRSRFGVSEEAFEAGMPNEFWREVVERMAREAPDTLLLAEAFWLMEGYFVRTLGMHRVYNSAFMHMLMGEENAAYRRLIRSVQAFDPRVLERFVNFMSNPDEESAADQFGSGDKYFGVTTLLATLPGLPMFGHGQVEGLREKYGMEYRRAKLDEQPNPDLIRRHRETVAPLLRQRARFAGATSYRLYDLVTDDGQVDEDVYVFTNRSGGEALLVAFNNSHRSVRGRARFSAPFTDRDRGGELRSEPIVDALGLRPGAGPWVTLTEYVGGENVVVAYDELTRGGLTLELGPYQARVFLEVRQGDTLPEARSEASPVKDDVVGTAWRAGGSRRRGDAVLCRPRGFGARRRRSARRRATVAGRRR